MYKRHQLQLTKAEYFLGCILVRDNKFMSLKRGRIEMICTSRAAPRANSETQLLRLIQMLHIKRCNAQIR